MEIEFNGVYQKDIYFRTIRWIYKPSTKTLLFRIGIFVIFGGLYVAAIVTSFQKDGVSTFELSKLGRHLITFLILGYVLLQPYIGSQQKAMELWGDQSIHRRLTGRVSSLGIIVDPMRDWLTWDKFVKVNKMPDGIALLTASRMFVLLQRDFFQTEQDWKQVQGLVDTKVREVIE